VSKRPDGSLKSVFLCELRVLDAISQSSRASSSRSSFAALPLLACRPLAASLLHAQLTLPITPSAGEQFCCEVTNDILNENDKSKGSNLLVFSFCRQSSTHFVTRSFIQVRDRRVGVTCLDLSRFHLHLFVRLLFLRVLVVHSAVKL